MIDWKEALNDALTVLDESTFFSNHTKLQGDTMMILRTLVDDDLAGQPFEKLNKIYDTIDDLLNAIQDDAPDAHGNQRRLLETANQHLEAFQAAVRDEKETTYEAKQLGTITVETTIDDAKKTITLRARYTPYSLYRNLDHDDKVRERLTDQDEAKELAANIRDAVKDIIDTFDFLIKPDTATIDISFTTAEHLRASIEPRSTPSHVWLNIGVTRDMLEDNDLTSRAKDIITHELTHVYDDAPRKESDHLDYALLIKLLRQEGIPTFAEAALRRNHYQPSPDEPLEDINDLLEPLPDDLHEAQSKDKIQADQQVLRYAEGRAPYDLGKAMIDLIYLHRLDKDDAEDSQERRIHLLKHIRNHDVNAFIDAY
jgi:ElaB/YqjD/DUF883 family membrane-anchored ribosome-binding protein